MDQPPRCRVDVVLTEPIDVIRDFGTDLREIRSVYILACVGVVHESPVRDDSVELFQFSVIFKMLLNAFSVTEISDRGQIRKRCTGEDTPAFATGN